MKDANSAAIIGPGKIGKIYLRELIKLKYLKIFLYGGRKKIDVEQLGFLEEKLKKKITINHYKKLNKKIKKCNIICICSPTNTHLKYIQLLNNLRSKIIIEKPLVSIDDLQNININNFLKKNILERKKFLCSYPLSFYAKTIKKIINKKKIKKIKFKYHTTGKNTYKNIPEDLLPHSISFIYEFFKSKINNFKNFKKKEYKNKWICSFQIENTKIIFYFKQNIKSKNSKLEIFLDNLKISRETVSLPNHDLNTFLKIKNKRFKIKNPLSENIKLNYNKLVKNRNLMSEYHLNLNIIFLTKNFINYEK